MLFILLIILQLGMLRMFDTQKYELSKNIVDELLLEKDAWLESRVVQPDQWNIYAECEIKIERMYEIVYKMLCECRT